MRIIRHSVLLIATLVLGPIALAVALLRGRFRSGLRERLGAPKRRSDRPVWVHVASVGEAAAARALIDALAQAGAPLWLTSQTPGGRARLAADHPSLPRRLAPIDHPWIAARALSRVNPRVLVLVETEIWPGLIAAADRRGIPVAVVSGRLSERAYRIQHELHPLFRSTFERLSVVGARSEADAERFVSLGTSPSRVRVSGDLKWAKKAPERSAVAPEIAAWMSRRSTVVAGSMHPDEDETLVAAMISLRAEHREVQWLVAPRHPADAGPLLHRLASSGFHAIRRTALEGAARETAEVLVLDTLGELASTWSHGLVAIVGGTFGSTGGHDLLEPAHAGRPVVFGPSTHGVVEVAHALTSAGAAVQVQDAPSLAAAVARLLDAPRERAELVARATTVLEEGRTALAANVELVTQAARGQWVRRSTAVDAALESTSSPAGLYAKTGPDVPAPVSALLRVASVAYAAGARIDRATARFGTRRPTRLPCAVVSVGSWLAGGSAKTPISIWLAGALRDRGHRVAVVTRGHGVSLGRKVVIANHGHGVCESAAHAGDETVAIAEALPDVPVLASRDRLRAGRVAMVEFGCEVLVIDDGHQHAALHRDLDLVCLDARIGLGNGRVLPAGPLREPASAFDRADALVVTGGSLPDDDVRRIERHAPGLRRFHGERRPTGWRDLRTGVSSGFDALADRKVGLLAGLADPASFRQLAEAGGVIVEDVCIRTDHHRHGARELARLADGPETWITTTKDAAKIDPFDLPDGIDLFVLEFDWQPVESPTGALIDYVEEHCGLAAAADVDQRSVDAKSAPRPASLST